MELAFIDHSYHRVTGSSRFFARLLEQIGTVHYFYDQTWSSGGNEWQIGFNPDDFDVIIVWQSHEALDAISPAHPNVIFIPMYDAMLVGSVFYWKQRFSSVRCISFCWKLHQEITQRGGQSRYFKYFPDPSGIRHTKDFESLRGFFWYRRPEINLSTIERITQGTPIDLLTVHRAHDPIWQPRSMGRKPVTVRKMTITSWLESANQYRAVLEQHNVFFGSREYEGIGMSMLEAMARGMCVVASNSPTMNEYIANGTNGLLWSPDRITEIDFSRAAAIGARARETIERGFVEWKNSVSELADFILKAEIAPTPSQMRNVGAGVQNKTMPSISIVTVCLDASDCLKMTIDSVLSQNYPDFEYIVLDGGSTDCTIEIIKAHSNRLTYWQSEPDHGVYFAMNKAISICSKEWILFMNAGDTFAHADALNRLFRHATEDMDVVFGHHIYAHNGKREYRAAADFEMTWARLLKGDLWFDWLAGIPGHQATAVRRRVLERMRFDTDFKIAADQELLFRARRAGAKFFNCDEIVSVYLGGGYSARNYALCKKEWLLIAERYGNPQRAHEFYAHLDKVEQRAAPKPFLGRLRSVFKDSCAAFGFDRVLSWLSQRRHYF